MSEVVMEKRTYSIPEAGKLLGISRGAAYDAAAKGDLPTIRMGGRKLVSKVVLDRLLSGETK